MIWELIAENKRKSWYVFIGMGLCLIAAGYFIGAAWFGSAAALNGVFIAFAVWIGLSAVSFFAGDSILLLSSGAREITHDIHPQLFNVVEEMKIAAGLPKCPKIYIIDDPAMNAFATGRNPEKSTITVTAGLLSSLNRNELQGVIAHEMAHILNRDILYMTFGGVMLGSIVMLSEVFLRSAFYGRRSSSRRYRSGDGQGQAQIILFVAAIVVAILAPILARIFYFALSRRREYLADATGVRLSRYPEGLASALEKISNSYFQLAAVNKITAPMYIDNPYKKQAMAVSGLFSTHPPVERRIKILRSITQGVNFAQYEEAAAKVAGKAGIPMPASAINDRETIAIRRSSIEEEKIQKPKEKARDIGDLMRVVNNYAFIVCLCGLKIKIPPGFTKEKFSCPRCGHAIEVPLANLKNAVPAAAALKTAGMKEEKPLQEYAKQTLGWESFSCANCGGIVHISPLYTGERISCLRCNSEIRIKKPA